MQFSLQNPNTGSWVRLFSEEKKFNRFFYSRDQDTKLFTIAWNKGEEQTDKIDGDSIQLPGNALLPLMFNQSFEFGKAEDIVAWRREISAVEAHSISLQRSI
jgi:AraC family transcriptional activator of pobA